MNALLIIANILTFLTFVAHTFWGDKDLRGIEPSGESNENDVKRLERWTMARGAFHIVSMDFFLATVGLFLINFTDLIAEKSFALNALWIYFLAYSIGFFLSVALSKPFSKNYIKLGQWILLLTISACIFFGARY